MAVDMVVWRKLVFDEVESIADENQQRKTWFGIGDLVDSPGEQFCAFFDNACVPEFLARPDHGLSEDQARRMANLRRLMRLLSDDMPTFIKPEDLIDDPRWIEIRKQAAETLKTLSDGD